MAEAELSGEAVKGVGDFDCVEVFALDVLDEGDFEELVVGDLPVTTGTSGIPARRAARQRRSPATNS